MSDGVVYYCYKKNSRRDIKNLFGLNITNFSDDLYKLLNDNLYEYFNGEAEKNEFEFDLLDENIFVDFNTKNFIDYNKDLKKNNNLDNYN
jgi:hypothetical protein